MKCWQDSPNLVILFIYLFILFCFINFLVSVSYRYRKQMEEMQRAFNKTIIKLQNTSRIAEEQVSLPQLKHWEEKMSTRKQEICEF